jgi:hypothetical protein
LGRTEKLTVDFKNACNFISSLHAGKQKKSNRVKPVCPANNEANILTAESLFGSG